jgi:hypothetical protein
MSSKYGTQLAQTDCPKAPQNPGFSTDGQSVGFPASIAPSGRQSSESPARSESLPCGIDCGKRALANLVGQLSPQKAAYSGWGRSRLRGCGSASPGDDGWKGRLDEDDQSGASRLGPSARRQRGDFGTPSGPIRGTLGVGSAVWQLARNPDRAAVGSL